MELCCHQCTLFLNRHQILIVITSIHTSGHAFPLPPTARFRPQNTLTALLSISCPTLQSKKLHFWTWNPTNFYPRIFTLKSATHMPHDKKLYLTLNSAQFSAVSHLDIGSHAPDVFLLNKYLIYFCLRVYLCGTSWIPTARIPLHLKYNAFTSFWNLGKSPLILAFSLGCLSCTEPNPSPTVHLQQIHLLAHQSLSTPFNNSN